MGRISYFHPRSGTKVPLAFFVLINIFFFLSQLLAVALSTTNGAPAPQNFGAFNFQGVGFNRETGKGYVQNFMFYFTTYLQDYINTSIDIKMCPINAKTCSFYYG